VIGEIAAAARLEQKDDAGSAGGSVATGRALAVTLSARAEPAYAAGVQQQAVDAARYRLVRDWWFGLTIAPEDLRSALTPSELDLMLDEGLRRRAAR
jgi:hypothetical protein